MLIHIWRHPSVAAAESLAMARRAPSSRFDIVSAMPSASFRPSAPPQRRCNALATNAGAISGIIAGKKFHVFIVCALACYPDPLAITVYNAAPVHLTCLPFPARMSRNSKCGVFRQACAGKSIVLSLAGSGRVPVPTVRNAERIARHKALIHFHRMRRYLLHRRTGEKCLQLWTAPLGTTRKPRR